MAQCVAGAGSLPVAAVPSRGPWPRGTQVGSLFCPSPPHAGLHISPAQPFTLKALSLPCPVGGFDVLLSIAVLAPVARAHCRLTHQVLVCAGRLEAGAGLGAPGTKLRALNTCETRASVSESLNESWSNVTPITVLGIL